MSCVSFLADKLFVIRCRIARPSWWRLYQTALEHDKWSADQLAELFQTTQQNISLHV